MNLEEKSKERILKLLMLTGSDNDHEALSAIRMANSMLKKAGAMWKDLFVESVPQYRPEPPRAKRKSSPKARPARENEKFTDRNSLSQIYEDLKKSSFFVLGSQDSVQWVVSMAEQFNRLGFLTSDQFLKLSEIYQEYVARKKR